MIKYSPTKLANLTFLGRLWKFSRTVTIKNKIPLPDFCEIIQVAIWTFKYGNVKGPCFPGWREVKLVWECIESISYSRVGDTVSPRSVSCSSSVFGSSLLKLAMLESDVVCTIDNTGQSPSSTDLAETVINQTCAS